MRVPIHKYERYAAFSGEVNIFFFVLIRQTIGKCMMNALENLLGTFLFLFETPLTTSHVYLNWRHSYLSGEASLCPSNCPFLVTV